MLLWCGGSGALGAAGSFSEKYQRIAYWVQAEQQSKKFLFIKKKSSSFAGGTFFEVKPLISNTDFNGWFREHRYARTRFCLRFLCHQCK